MHKKMFIPWLKVKSQNIKRSKIQRRKRLFHLSLICSFQLIDLRTKEIGESSKTILEKKTNKHVNNRLSTTNNTKQRPTTTSESHSSPSGVPSNPAVDRPLRFNSFQSLLFFILSFQRTSCSSLSRKDLQKTRTYSSIKTWFVLWNNEWRFVERELFE